MITYQKSHLKVAEFYFNEQERAAPADIVRFHFRPSPVPDSENTDRYTIQLDLGETSDKLYGGMNKETRYEIRRAEKERMTYEFTSDPDAQWLEEFIGFYDRFADSKHIPHANRERLEGMQRHNALDLSRMRSEDGAVLVYHAYIRLQGCARLHHSGSLFRVLDKSMATTVSRANRLLHWADIQRFREEGMELYDLGGWYEGKTDEEKLKVNRFKESFGGTTVHQYSADRLITWKATAAWHVRNAVHALSGRFR